VAGGVVGGERGGEGTGGGESAVVVVPEEVVDGGVELVGVVDPAAVGMEGEMAGAGLEAGLPEGLRGGCEGTGEGVGAVDVDAVGAEVVDEEPAAVVGGGGFVGVGLLVCGLGVDGGELEVRDGRGELAGWGDGVGGEAAAAVVGGEGGAAVGADGDVCGSVALGALCG